MQRKFLKSHYFDLIKMAAVEKTRHFTRYLSLVILQLDQTVKCADSIGKSQ